MVRRLYRRPSELERALRVGLRSSSRRAAEPARAVGPGYHRTRDGGRYRHDRASRRPRVIEPEDERYNARLVRRDDQHASLAYFWVRFDGEPTPFEPGQYMTIGVFVDGKIVQRPYSVASRARGGRRRRLRVLRPARPGRHVHAAAVAAAGRPPDADDRPEGQVHARARRRPDPPVHLVGHRQRAVRRDDAAAAHRRARRGGPSSSTASRTQTTWATATCSRAGRRPASTR